MRRLPGWLLFILAALGWGVLVELGSYAYLRALRDNLENPISWLLHGMVDKFHPLFRESGHFTASNYYPYIAAYYEGDWSKTPAPAPMHPDGWVLPAGKDADGRQLYVTPEKAPGTIRVIALGGSTMVGMGQSTPEKSIPRVLEGLLRQAYPDKKIEVVNGAFYTAIAAQELAALSTKLIVYHPDLILVMDGFNEFVRVYHFPDMPPFWSTAHEQMYRTYSRVQTFKGVTAQLGFLLSKRFYSLAILRAIRYNKRFMAVAATAPDKPLDQRPFIRAVDEYLSVHRSLLGIAQAHGVPIILAAQPNVYHAKPRSQEETDIIRRWDDGKPRFREASEFFHKELDARYAAFSREPGSKDVHRVNLTRLFKDESETLFVDSCHYNDLGAEKIARAFVPLVAQALHLPARKP